MEGLRKQVLAILSRFFVHTLDEKCCMLCVAKCTSINLKYIVIEPFCNHWHTNSHNYFLTEYLSKTGTLCQHNFKDRVYKGPFSGFYTCPNSIFMSKTVHISDELYPHTYI